MIAQREIYVALPAELDAPATENALKSLVPAIILNTWRELALDNVDTGDYLAHLTLDQAVVNPFNGDPDTVALINFSEHAQWVDEGHAGFHLASRWGSRGGRWKVGKNGNLYAHVPFRIGTPIKAGGGASSGRARLGATMPGAVYRRARALVTSRDRLSGFGNTYKQSKSYNQFRGAGEKMPSHLDATHGYTWKASQFEGLFADIQRTPDAPRHATYMTIRTITPDSLGWFIPSKPGHHFPEKALEESMPQIQEVLALAEAQDIANAIDNILGDVL